ncbi:MAG TPA: nuclear transport factor 2 family protein [Chthoniobacterales bacterium]
MKKLIALALIGLFATSAAVLASPDKDALITAEKNAWQNLKDKKFDDFKKIFSADFRGVYGSGIHKLDQEMTEVKGLDLKSYTLGDIDVVFIDKDAALLTYSVTVEGTDGGKDASGKMNASSIWKKEGNDWRCVFHTDMKAE